MASDEREQAPAPAATAAATELDASPIDTRVAEAAELGESREPSGLRLENITKRFKGGIEAVKDVSLDVEPGEFMVLVGPSGCGKSTLLRIMAGLEEVSGPRLPRRDKGRDDPAAPASRHRDVSRATRHPRMTVRRNMVLARACGALQAERQRWAARSRDSGPEHLLSRRPGALSGAAPACCHGPGDRPSRVSSS
jgi:ABC-type sugar transport system ATPase subunit